MFQGGGPGRPQGATGRKKKKKDKKRKKNGRELPHSYPQLRGVTVSTISQTHVKSLHTGRVREPSVLVFGKLHAAYCVCHS